jgi:hypothetical protein
LYTEGDPISLALPDVMGDDDLRLFAIMDQAEFGFAVAYLDGRVLAPDVTRVVVQ